MYPGQTDAIRKLFRENFQTCEIFLDTSATPRFTNANIIDGSLTLTRTGIHGTDFKLGEIGTSTLVFEVANFDHQFDYVSFENHSLRMQISVTDDTTSVPHTFTMNMGRFIVTDSVNLGSRLRITAQDRSILLDKPASNLSTTNNNIYEIAQLCLDRCGITAANNGLANMWCSQLVVTPPPDGKYTYRDVLSMALQCGFQWGFVDWNGEFRLTGPGNTNQSFGKDVVMDKTDTYAKETIGVSRLVIDDVVYGPQTGYITYVKNNPIATQIMDEMGTEWVRGLIQTFGFMPFSLSCKSVPYMWPIDGISLTARLTSGWYSIIGSIVYTLNGVSSMSIKAPTETQESYTSGSSFTQSQNYEITKIVPKIYDAVALGDLTIGSNGYVQISKPGQVQGKKIISVGVLTWTSNTGAFSIVQMEDGNQNAYIVGTPGVVVRGLKLRWVYL